MADLWDETLQPASFDGIEFPIASRAVGGGRAWARRRYPYRPGQDGEDTGREPYTFELEVPLFADVDPDHYPGVYDALRLALDDPSNAGRAEYVDPEYGPMIVQVDTWTWRTTSGARNGGVLTLKLEEVSHDDLVVSVDARDAQRAAGDAAAELDERAEDLGISEEELEDAFGAAGVPLDGEEKDKLAGDLWSTQLERFVEWTEDGAAAVDELASRLDRIRGRLDVLTSRPEMQAPAAMHAHHAAARLAAALGEVGEAMLLRAPPLVEHVLLSEQSVYEVSAQLYGTPDRAAEILARNPSPSPLFLQAGTKLVVLAA